jgi:hypothetical protein
LDPNEKTLKAIQIISENDELYRHLWATEVQSISAHVGLRKIQGEEGRLNLEIVIDSQTTIRELEENWKIILDARSKLAQIQGEDLSEFLSELLRAKLMGEYIKRYETIYKNVSEGEGEEMLSNLIPIKKKPSWSELTMDVNFDLLVCLVRIAQKEHDSKIGILANKFFMGVISNFGFFDYGINKFREDGIIKLKSGQCPWNIRVEPIETSAIRLKVRSLQDKYGQRLKMILTNNNSPTLRDIRLLFLRKGDWMEAARVLEQTCPRSFSRYEQRLNARMSELLLYQRMRPLNDDSFMPDDLNIIS